MAVTTVGSEVVVVASLEVTTFAVGSSFKVELEEQLKELAVKELVGLLILQVLLHF